MKAELKAKWIAALRSGEYQQGHNMLVSDDGKKHCCIGVLAKLCGIPQNDMYDNRFQLVFTGFEQDDLKIGLPMRQRSQLATMNDEGTNSFKDIADWIEGNL